jgi:hypothetical protein
MHCRRMDAATSCRRARPKVFISTLESVIYDTSGVPEYKTTLFRIIENQRTPYGLFSTVVHI